METKQKSKFDLFIEEKMAEKLAQNEKYQEMKDELNKINIHRSHSAGKVILIFMRG